MTASVIIAAYNNGQYIGEALQSVVDQLPDGQVIVVDDGSTDNTPELLSRWLDRPGFIYAYQTNRGKAAATRKGLSLANGSVICTLDADDWYLPTKLDRSLAAFAEGKDIVHVASPALIHWEDGHRPRQAEPVPAAWLDRPLDGHDLLADMYRRNLIFGGGSTFVALAETLKSFPLPDEVDMYTDEWLLIHSLLKGNSFFFPEPLSVWRVHGGNFSGEKGEIKEEKWQRQRRASAYILQWLEEGNYPAWLVKAYRLKHAVRCLAWDENAGKKSLADRMRFLNKLVLKGYYSPAMLHRYGAFGRLLK